LTPGGKRSSEYPGYVGEEGMMAFIAGQYSDRLPAAGMLAYVMDGLPDKAWLGLTKRIEAEWMDLRMREGHSLVRSSLLPFRVGIHLGETLHDLTNRQLRILHLILSKAATNQIN
jgi:hypothetical protein